MISGGAGEAVVVDRLARVARRLGEGEALDVGTREESDELVHGGRGSEGVVVEVDDEQRQAPLGQPRRDVAAAGSEAPGARKGRPLAHERHRLRSPEAEAGSGPVPAQPRDQPDELRLREGLEPLLRAPVRRPRPDEHGGVDRGRRAGEVGGEEVAAEGVPERDDRAFVVFADRVDHRRQPAVGEIGVAEVASAADVRPGLGLARVVGDAGGHAVLRELVDEGAVVARRHPHGRHDEDEGGRRRVGPGGVQGRRRATGQGDLAVLVHGGEPTAVVDR